MYIQQNIKEGDRKIKQIIYEHFTVDANFY